MLIWVASYPRSGNTFLRIVLHRVYGAPTYVIYDVDGVAALIGGELMGFRERPGSIDEMRASDEVYFVKTHRQRDGDVADDDRMLCLVRDGREAVTSWAHLECRSFRSAGSELYQTRFEEHVRKSIMRSDAIGTGAWGRNVLSWLSAPAPHRVVVHYDELVAAPVATVRDAIVRLAPDLQPVGSATVPSFNELQQVDGTFFRRGASGSHREELPEHLQELFWAQPESVAAMELLGYPR